MEMRTLLCMRNTLQPVYLARVCVCVCVCSGVGGREKGGALTI